MSEERQAEGYVLHARRYRESSQLLELLTAEEGRISGLLRRGRSGSGSAAQAFMRLQVHWRARGSLPTLSRCEELGRFSLTGERAVCGLYVNELCLKLLPRDMPLAEVYAAYEACLAGLADAQQPLEPLLRRFEWQLLVQLGEGLEFIDASELDAAAAYMVLPQDELRLALEAERDSAFCIQGATLQAVVAGTLSDRVALREARRLMRALLDYHLGSKTIVSRQLITRMHREKQS